MATPPLAASGGLAVLIAAATALGQPQLATVRVASGFARPLYLTSPPGDLDRLFVVEQSSGRIRIIDDGVVLPQPFLDIQSRIVTSGGNEQGLLGMAFHPDYDRNGFFYVHYSRRSDGATIVERYTVSGTDPDLANPESGTIVLGPVPQPFRNHNGGQLAFGPDGFLYIALGDGGSQGDPACRAQRLGTLLGKVLRIDVDGGSPYAVPPSNPFVGMEARGEIWTYGWRNPWRFSFDRANGDMYVGDVGQSTREEVSWQSGRSSGGENFGWKIMEGFTCFSTANCPPGVPSCNSPALELPIHDYPTSGGNCAVVGGYVYRGCAIPGLEGTYFFGDYCSGRIWSLRYDGSSVSEFTERTAELVPQGGGSIGRITSFGEDARGEIYIVDRDGEIFRIVAASGSPARNLGFATTGGNGEQPRFELCGLLGAGQSAELLLRQAIPNAPAAMVVADTNSPTPFPFGTIVPVPPDLFFSAMTDANGQVMLTAPGGLGPAMLTAQWLVLDGGATAGVALSNALEITWL